MEIIFVDFDNQFLQASTKWLQDEEIRVLINAPKFDPLAQSIWFESLKDKADYFIWGMKYNGEMIGVVGLKNITEHKGEYWGYIGERKYWGMGLGKAMVSFIEEKSIELDINLISLKVSTENMRAISLYKNVGFIYMNNIDENFIFMQKELTRNIK
jgi:RimJ/RimL family protein N-acetyltransferase